MARVLQLREHELAPGVEVDLADALRVVYVDRGEVHVGPEPSPRVRRCAGAGATRCRRGMARSCSCSSWSTTPIPTPRSLPRSTFRARVWCAATASTFRPAGWPTCIPTKARASAASSSERSAVETDGRALDIPLGGAWFEAGPEPVYAEVVGDGPAAFVRVMVLPADLLGQSHRSATSATRIATGPSRSATRCSWTSASTA